MNKRIVFIACISMFIGSVLPSCVPTKKLRSSEERVGRLQQDSVNAIDQLKDCKAIVSNLKAEMSSMQNEYALAQKDLKVLADESNNTIADQAKRLKILQDLIQSQKNVMVKLKNSISDALMKYKTDELNVYIKDGNVYVSLEEKLLFKSGSDVVDPKGKEALKSLAQVLNNTKDIKVIIEGHTDKVPIKTSKFKDNWDLSTARATSIVRILTSDNGFDPSRITAAGKGQFHPVKTNTTVAGRAGNRRTEVILSPDLKEFFTILNQ